MTELHEKAIPGWAKAVVNFSIGRPKTALLTSLVLLGTMLPGIARMRPDFSYRIWFRESDPLLHRFDAFERRFGSDENALLIVHSEDGIFDASSMKLLQAATEDLWQVPEVIRVDGLTNFNWVHAEDDDIIVEPLIPDDAPLTPEVLDARKKIALEHEVLPGYLISADAKTALVFAHLKPSFEGSPDYEAVIHGVRGIVEKYADGEHVFHITGAAAISQAFKESTQADMQKIVPIVLSLTVALLVVLFRSFGGVALPMLVVFFSILTTLSFAGWAGIPFTNMTSIVPQILIAVGIADAVHILTTFFIARRAGHAQLPSARHSLIKNFTPTVLTSVTTAIGFFSFSTAELKPLGELGVLAGFGAVVAWFLTYLIIGPLMVLVPLKVREVENAPDVGQAGPFAQRAAAWVAARRGPIIGFYALFTLAAVGLALRAQVNSDPFKYFSESFWLRQANEYVEAHVGGSMGAELMIESGAPEGVKDPAFLMKVDAFQKWIEAKPYVTKAVSVLDPVKQVYRSMHGDDDAYYAVPDAKKTVAEMLFLYTMSLPQGMDINDRVTIESDALRLTALWNLHDSSTVLRTAAEWTAKAREMGLDVLFTGKSILYQGMNPRVVRSFVVSVSAALILISLLLVFAFGSLKSGLIAMIPNTLPLVFGGALLTVLDKPLDIGTVIVASVCLGIAVDDTIHFIANFNRLTGEGRSPQEAVAHVFSHTGPALIGTTVVLVGAFGAFVFGTFMPNVNLGIMVASVLSFALVADLTLLPAILIAATPSPKA